MCFGISLNRLVGIFNSFFIFLLGLDSSVNGNWCCLINVWCEVDELFEILKIVVLELINFFMEL